MAAAGQTSPPLSFLRERARACLGDAVVLRLAIILGSAPTALDPAVLLEANERWIQRALLQRETGLGHSFKTGGETVGVLGAHRLQRAQQNEVQSAL